MEQELLAFLDAATPPGGSRDRNISIVRHFYGFSEAVWPTLDSTAERFGLGSRERVRQILNTAFRDKVELANLPVLRTAARLLGSRSFWTAREFRQMLARDVGKDGSPSLPGLVHLMHDLALVEGYELFDHNLERLTRSHFTGEATAAIARAEIVPQLKQALQYARRIACRLGVAHTSYLGEDADPEAVSAQVKALIRVDPNCWMSSRTGEAWYAPETRENALVGLAAKVFAVTETISSARLAETLANALKARSTRKPCPGRAEIKAWILGSRYFAHDGERALFLDAPGKLTAVEQELVSYLSSHERCDYKAIKAHLQSRGIVNSLIPKAATQSPLVYVDRSGGFKSYSYSLIGRE